MRTMAWPLRADIRLLESSDYPRRSPVADWWQVCCSVVSRTLLRRPFGGSIVQRRRRRVAVLLMSVLAFTQVATAAHACPILSPSSQPLAEAAQLDPVMPMGCAGMAKRASSTVNVCQSHCIATQQVDTQADMPAAPIAPRPALTVRDADSFVPTRNAAAAPSLISVAWPPLLRFSRLLI